MALRNLFKPRWRHRDAAVRADAAAGLDPHRDGDTLTALAERDDSPRVRAAAAAALLDLAVLDRLIRDDGDADVREAASQRIMALLAGEVSGGPDPATRQRLIAHTDNPRVLQHVARHSPDPDSRRAALAAINDAQGLYELALHGQDAALRLAAAERLDDDALLRQLGRDGRDKKVVRLARERLKDHQKAAAERQQRDQERDQALAALEQLAQRASDPLFDARLGQLEQRWRAVAEDASADQRARAERALAQGHEQIEARHREQRAVAVHDAAVAERQAALDTLRALLSDLTTDTWDQQLGELRSAVATQERRWQAAAEDAPGDDDQELAFRSQLDEWRRLISLAEAAREQEEPEQRLELARQWPARVAPPSTLLGLSEAAEEAAPETPPPARRGADKAAPSRHRGLVVSLRRELERGNLKHANRLWLKAEAVLAEESDPWLARQLERHSARREELRDWHAFAAQPKKEELCQRMETLADADMDPEERASAIQALHDEWRSLMSSDQDQDQALWDRFKAASDRAYEPCRAHFRELDAQRSENLEKRRALCAQLAEFVAGENWEKADWESVWEIRRRAPREWQSHAPVRFTDARDLQKRFSALLTEIDERLDQAWQQAESQRQAMIEEARALTEQQDVHAAARQARELQTRWRAAPWLPPARHRNYQKTFRGLMDALFGARQAASQARDEQRREQREKASAILAECEQWLERPLGEQDDGDLAARAAALEELVPAALDKGQQRRHQQLRERLRQWRAELPRWRRWRNARQRLADAPDGDGDDGTLAVALEALAGVESPQQARQERLAWQLEQLPRAMKSAGQAPLDEALKLVEERPETAPLEADTRQRLLAALDALEPGEGRG